MHNDKPPISIGLPVYNGERYLRESLDSILAQTFEDFELIISDNASTDGTDEICKAYVAKDPRIHYYRNNQNLGCTWNFNRVFRLSSAKYFKWVAYDDIHRPDFLQKCKEVLDKKPDVILCHTKVKIIDEYGKFLQNYSITLNTGSPKPQERCHALLSKHLCYQMYGLIRASALKMTPLMGPYAHSDEILLLRLGLLGPFHEIPQFMFYARKHPQQSISLFCPNYLDFASQNPPNSLGMLPDYYSYTLWFDPSKKGKIFFPHWRILHELLLSIWRAPLSWYDRIGCYLSVLKQNKGESLLLIKDLIIAAKSRLQR